MCIKLYFSLSPIILSPGPLAWNEVATVVKVAASRAAGEFAYVFAYNASRECVLDAHHDKSPYVICGLYYVSLQELSTSTSEASFGSPPFFIAFKFSAPPRLRWETNMEWRVFISYLRLVFVPAFIPYGDYISNFEFLFGDYKPCMPF